MRKTALLSLIITGLGASSSALAGQDLEDYGNVESTTLSSATSVPLYTTPWGSVQPCVQVMIGEDVYIFGLELGHGIYVGERVSAELGLEPKEKKDKNFKPIKTAEIEKITIGAMELNNVTVLAQAPEDNDKSPFYETIPSGWALDGYIGLSTLKDVAWSIQPSTGEVVFAPLAEGGELVNGLKDGATYTWRSTEMKVEKYGKTKIPVAPTGMIIPVGIGGVDVEVMPSFGWWNSAVSSATEGLAEGPSQNFGDNHASWLSVSIGKQSIDSWVNTGGAAAGSFEMLTREQFTQDYADGIVGARVLSQFDIAADPTNNTIAFRHAPEQTREDPIPFLIEDATADAEKMPEPPEGEAADPDAKPGSSKAWLRLGGLQEASGDLASAIESYTKRLDYGDNATLCSPHQLIGITQLNAGLLDDAIASLNTASDLYHGWWDQDLETRKEIEAALGEFENDEEKAASEYADTHVQPGSCFTVDGELAKAWISQGDTEKVHELFAEHIDLDENLALVEGNAALIEGNLSVAAAAYQQAAMLEGGPDYRSRLGLALVKDNAGEWEHAEELYRSAVTLNPYNSMVGQLWVDASIRAKSAAATTRATEQFLAAYPDSGSAYTAHARALRLAGDTGKLAQLTRRGDAYFASERMLFPSSGYLAASHALFMVETGRLEEGRAAAEAALIADPDATLAWLALGNIYVLNGDVNRGENMFKRAGQLNAYSPGYALLINTDIPEPQPEPVEEAPE